MTASLTTPSSCCILVAADRSRAEPVLLHDATKAPNTGCTMGAGSMVRRPVPVLFIATATGLTGHLNAQEVAGSVQGTIVGASGQPEPEVQVAVSGRNLLGIRTALTDRDGFFQVSALPPGEYTVRIGKIGVRPVVVERVSVQLGRTTAIGPVALEAQPVALEPVVVTARAATLDPAHTTVGATLDAADYAALPADRDYKSIIAILPHVNTSYYGDPVNVGGSTGIENMYFIDGVNVTDPLNATTGTSLPYNFVRAVEVKVGGYEAQYGKALGAIVNAVTYSGTNHFEGNLFAFFTNSALAASPKAQPTLMETGSASYDIGARLSGPIVHDRLWFSAAYNPRVERVEKEIPPFGTFTDKQTAQIFAGKLTWQVAPQATVELSLLGDRATHHQVSFGLGASLTPASSDWFLALLETGGVTGSVRATVSPRPGLLLEASLARSWGRQNFLPETDAGQTEPLYVDWVSGTVEGGLGSVSRVTQHRTGATLRSTITAGRHTVVAGSEYEDVEVSRTSRNLAEGVIQRLDSATFSVDSEGGTGVFHNRLPTAYAQDAWRISDRLTLSAGMRWSGQFLTGASGGIAQRFANEWQPRLGFSWQLGGSGTQRVFGSYGRFYQQEPLNLASVWYLDWYATFKYYSADPRQAGAPLDSVKTGTTYEKDWARSIDGVKAENLDEFTLGYERLLGAGARFTVRGIRRDLRSSFNWGEYLAPGTDSLVWVLGTPGKGDFAFLPSPKRQYTALEVGVEGSWRRVQYRASYVLSRAWGNYTGLYASDFYFANPGNTLTFNTPWQAKNSTGLLPNDRTHVMKLVVVSHVWSSLVAGAIFTWQSGSPTNEFGAGPLGPIPPAFLAPRGSGGRAPAIWDLNLRIAYDTPLPRRARVLLDLLHVANPREVVRVDQQHFFGLDQNGNQTLENPKYLSATAFQPPMTARLGVEVSF